MHVLITADTIGGVWTYTRELVCGLVRRGVQVTLVSFGEIPTAAQAEWLDGQRNVDFRPTAFRLEWMQEAPEDIARSRDYLQAVVEETRPDVLHLSQFCYGALPGDLPRVVVAHSDVVSWWAGVHGEEPRDSEWQRWYRRTVADGLSAATAVVAPSKFMLAAVAQHYVRPPVGSVIYNGRSPNLFNPHVTKEDVVLGVGRLWDGGKQLSLLAEIEAAIPVWIVGADKHPDAAVGGAAGLREAARQGLYIEGQRSESQLRHHYGRASMYAATSRYEPFGLAPLEAALSRCALICNDIPAFHEIWGDAARYFRRNDAASLAAEVACLQADRVLRLTYANLAYNRARQRYTADRMVSDYIALYEALVADQRRDSSSDRQRGLGEAAA
jgi:glycosyltransferase involved in cell wall biosynthesis